MGWEPSAEIVAGARTDSPPIFRKGWAPLTLTTRRCSVAQLNVLQLPMNPRISMDPQICHGKPAIRGTRVLVSCLLGALAGGDTMEQIQEDYQVSREDIGAALEFAKEASEYQVSSYDAVA